MKKEQSSIEWLIEQTRSLDWHSLKRGEILEKAKELHKKEIIEACENFGNINGVDIKDYKQYYNEKHSTE